MQKMFPLEENRCDFTDNLSASICSVQFGLLEHVSVPRRGRELKCGQPTAAGSLNITRTTNQATAGVSKQVEIGQAKKLEKQTKKKELNKIAYN